MLTKRISMIAMFQSEGFCQNLKNTKTGNNTRSFTKPNGNFRASTIHAVAAAGSAAALSADSIAKRHFELKAVYRSRSVRRPSDGRLKAVQRPSDGA